MEGRRRRFRFGVASWGEIWLGSDGHMDVESAKATKDVDLDEDIKDIDQQDRYEYLFNTRYEQENIVSYPR